MNTKACVRYSCQQGTEMHALKCRKTDKGARKKLQTKTHKIELRANFGGRIGKFRFLYKAWPKVANLHRLALALKFHFR